MIEDSRQIDLRRRALVALRDSITSETVSTIIDVMDNEERAFVDSVILGATNRIDVRIIE